MTINVSIAGAGGRMGRTLVRCMQGRSFEALSLCGAFERPDHPSIGHDVGSLCGIGDLGITLTAGIESASVHADVIIDFTSPASTLAICAWGAEHGKALVIGTTGLSADDHRQIESAARRVPIVHAPNMSPGVNLLLILVNQAARALREKGYDIEVIERHHRRKKDSPSGTALALGRAAAEGYGWELERVAVDGRTGVAPGDRPAEQIGFHAVRGGDIVGDHTVLFAAEGECVELSHRATSRDVLALGGLQAALWVARRPAGLYSMKDVLGL